MTAVGSSVSGRSEFIAVSRPQKSRAVTAWSKSSAIAASDWPWALEGPSSVVVGADSTPLSGAVVVVSIGASEGTPPSRWEQPATTATTVRDGHGEHEGPPGATGHVSPSSGSGAR